MNTKPSIRLPGLIMVVCTLALGLCAVAITLATFGRARPARAASLCVKAGGGDGCEAHIQEALNMAQPGDTILVAAGVYTENILVTQTVHLQGGWSPDFAVRDLSQYTSTIVPADESTSVVAIQGQFGSTSLVAPTVDGFEITGGRADKGSNHGGGMRIVNSDAMVISNTIHNNRAFYLGGGMWVQNGAPHLTGNRIENNLSDGLGQDSYGGGVALENSRATVLDNMISYNIVSGTQGLGGGMHLSSSPVTMQGNYFAHNIARGTTAGAGGGLFIEGDAFVSIHESTIFSNTTSMPGAAGGVYNYISSTLELMDVAITDNYGGSSVGGFANTGILSMTNVTINGNWADQAVGGGINASIGSMAILSSEISQNRSRNGTGGFINYGRALISSTLIQANHSDFGDGGVTNEGGILLIEASILDQNDGYTVGAIRNHRDSQLTLTRSVISRNDSLLDAGCILNGGYNQPAVLTITQSTLSGNTSQRDGGCLLAYSANIGPQQERVSISDSTFTDNVTPGKGGAILTYGQLSITDSTIANNQAGQGGGFHNFNQFYDVDLENVTIVGNQALDGGGIYNAASGLQLTNVTIANNQAGTGAIDQGDGGGLFNYSGLTVTLINTILASNEDLTPNVFGPDCYSGPGGMISLGHNLVRITDGCNWPSVPFDLVGDFNNPFEPQLGLLADNGGETQTLALLAGSQAIDAGQAQACPPTDQRGVPRPLDGDGDGQAACDMGAFEVQTPSSTTILSDVPDPSAPGEPFTVSFSVTASLGLPTGMVTVTANGDPGSCNGALAAGVGSCVLTLSVPGIYPLTAAYSGDAAHAPSSIIENHTIRKSSTKMYLPVILR